MRLDECASCGMSHSLVEVPSCQKSHFLWGHCMTYNQETANINGISMINSGLHLIEGRRTYAKMQRKMLPTRVTAWAAGALPNIIISLTVSRTFLRQCNPHVYGRRLNIVQPTAGAMVCGALAISSSAVLLGLPCGLICAKYFWAEDVAYVIVASWRRLVVIGTI